MGYAPTPGVGTLRFDTSADYGGNWTTRWARQGNQTSNKFESSTADSDGGTTGWLHAKVSLHYDGAPAMSVRAGSRSGAGVVPPGSDSGELVTSNRTHIRAVVTSIRFWAMTGASQFGDIAIDDISVFEDAPYRDLLFPKTQD